MAHDFDREKIKLSENVVYVKTFWKVILAACWKAKQKLLKLYQHDNLSIMGWLFSQNTCIIKTANGGIMETCI